MTKGYEVCLTYWCDTEAENPDEAVANANEALLTDPKALEKGLMGYVKAYDAGPLTLDSGNAMKCTPPK
jgi:hypothetical protein